jgi:hypothetical protein
MFKKISDIDNKLKAFVGVKVFQEAGKAINNSLKEYDKFKNSLNSLNETNISKQFESIKTSFAGTLGTVRDELINSLNNIFGGNNNFLETIEQKIPQIGAAIVATMSIAERIITNIKNNFDSLIKPEAWNDFFSHASSLAVNFGSLLANVLKDTFTFAVDFFNYKLENMNFLDGLLKDTGFGKFIDDLNTLGNKVFPAPDFLSTPAGAQALFGAFRGYNGEISKDKPPEPTPPPVFQLSEGAKKAFENFNTELGKTFSTALNTLAGTDVSVEYKTAFDEAFAKIEDIIGAMGKNSGLDELIRKKTNTLNESLSAASKSFSDANTIVGSIMGNTAGEWADPLREKMKGLNNQFQESTAKIDGLFNILKNAKSAEEVENLFKTINDEIKNMGDLAGSMNKLKYFKQEFFKENFSGANKNFTDANNNINTILGNTTGRAAEEIRGKMEALNLQFQVAAKNIEGLFNALKEAKNTEDIETIFKNISGGIENINKLADSMSGLKGEAQQAKNGFDLLKGVLQSIGELGTIIEAAMSKNWIGLIIMLIQKLASTFSSISSKVAAAQNILTLLFDVIGEVIAEMEPWLDVLFEPLLKIFEALGRVIGSLLSIIIPAVAVITQITDAFSFLTPILNVVAMIIAVLSDLIGTVWNKIVGFLNKIPFFDLPKMATDNYQKIIDNIDVERNYSDYQNNSTSYTVAGDMYINIYFSHSYVNGDSRQIAIMLRNEIRAAERAGY